MSFPLLKKIIFDDSLPYEEALTFSFHGKTPSALLKSSPQNGHRYSLAAFNPLMKVESFGGVSYFTTEKKQWTEEGNPFFILEKVSQTYKKASSEQHPFFNGGLLLALSYELKDFVDEDQTQKEKHSSTPDLIAVLYQDYFLFDEHDKTLCHLHLQSDVKPMSLEFAHDEKNKFQEISLHSNLQARAFQQKVEEIKAAISNGEVYQLNLAQQFRASLCLHPFQLFLQLAKLNPAPMMAYLETENLCLISSSPERFLKRSGNALETRPVKGTRSRGKNEAEDQHFLNELIESKKENAELSMIVDLMRNDVSQFALPNSVEVKQHRLVEKYQNVFQTLSVVSAIIPKHVSSVSLIRSCFPPGSVTGCPKLRAIEMIDKLEPNKRSFYCGSIGYLDFNGNFDLNVAIRTLQVDKDGVSFGLGSGIVYDSDPKSEYDESMVKGETLFCALSGEINEANS